jgi:threonine/homoserine/homoserine lactone efflux protein
VLDEILLSAGAGVAAGLGVAMPLGAIGALLLREGLVNGFRVAASAATGVAIVDTGYCAVAALVGATFAPLVAPHRGAFLLVSGLVILAIGVRQFVMALRRRTALAADPKPASPLAAFLRFVGLTAINPLTFVYFAALAGAIATRSTSWIGPVVFVVAVGLSSLAWQLMLATIGSLFGRSLGARTAEFIGIVATILLIALGGLVAISGLTRG